MHLGYSYPFSFSYTFSCVASVSLAISCESEIFTGVATNYVHQLFAHAQFERLKI
jgi:hypothetical protein